MNTDTESRREFDEWASDQTWLNLYGQSIDSAWEAWQAARESVNDRLDAILLRLGRSQEKMFDAERQRDRLADLVKQFVSILDITEESDSGRLFHPTWIVTGKPKDLQKIGEIVEALRKASRITNPKEL